MKQHEIAPIRIGRIPLLGSVAGPLSCFGRQKDVRQAARKLMRHLREIHLPARADRALDRESLAVKVMVALERLDEEVVQRKPDRSSPVGVAPKEARIRFSWKVLDPELLALVVKDIGPAFMHARKGTETMGR